MAGEVVTYVGTANRRVIRKETWEAAGVKGQDTVVWDKRNGYKVPVEQLNAAARKRLESEPTLLLPEQQKSAKSDDTSS